MKLPEAPATYDRRDQDQLRRTLEDILTRLEQAPANWQAPTGTATRTTFDTASVTLPQLAERVKAMIDDSQRVKS